MPKTLNVEIEENQNYKVPAKQLLSFVSNHDLYEAVNNVVVKWRQASGTGHENLFSNVIDPFSAVFDSACQGITIASWLNQERSRQIQKTLQNAVGDFHQTIIGSVRGWENLPTGSIVDVRNKKTKIIAEVKNKFNTTKFSDRSKYYETLKYLIGSDYAGYVAYYVEIIPRSKIRYDQPFTPSDHISKDRKSVDEKVRLMDGYTFYGKVTKIPTALGELYQTLPKVISDLLKIKIEKIADDDWFLKLFDKVY
jgi:hypothetical protein